VKIAHRQYVIVAAMIEVFAKLMEHVSVMMAGEELIVLNKAWLNLVTDVMES